MSDLPPPPIPAECSMAGNDWFPLHFDRLRKSKWWRRASDMARARNVMLWGEAYKAVPAGGLDDDDDDLAEAAGFGMDVESFLAAKGEIMAPWTLCSDGRWYHPTMCEVVLEAWERLGEKRKKDAAKKAAQRAKARGHQPKTGGHDGKTAHVPAENAPVPAENGNVPRDTPQKEGGQTHTGEDRTGEDTTEPPNPPTGGESAEAFEAAWQAYPEAGRATLGQAKAREAWDAATAAGANPDDLRAAVSKFAASAYATGGGKPRRFDRWLADGAFEGFVPNAAPAEVKAWPGPADLWSIAVHRMGPDWAAGYVGRCAWRDGALVCPSPTIAKGIRGEIGRDLDGLGYRLLEGQAA